MSNAYRVPVFESISAAWGKTKGFKGTYWAAWIVIMVISIGFGALTFLTDLIHPSVTVIFQLIQGVILYILNLGLMYLGIKRAANMPVVYTDIFYGFKQPVFLRLIGIILCLAVIFGILALFFIGGSLFTEGFVKSLVNLITFILTIFLSSRLFLAYAFVLDQNVHPLEAIKLSWKVTQGNVLRIIGVIIIISASYVLGFFALIIGLIWTIPFSLVYYGEIYKKFSDSLLPVPTK